ncbi:MAG: alcohol dehydrogenase catalytic domain-containing protein [Verrucomicrobia bacterium]|jgi:L-sorbose 1-phosphate reductase|nr:alcohol dehydrogenase catalytic domain-containing protein [Verrucomicrobiota bacterium]
MNNTIPQTQRAVQLVGPDELVLNEEKAVFQPNDYQILCKVVVVGLCFSDLKLLKQFSGHVRKSEVVGGIDPIVLDENPAYVPGEKAAVPGHEPVVEIVAAGDKVERFKVGERYMIQADWRWLATANSNGAFGYNFEGALQEFVLLDERIIISPDGVSMLLSAPAEQRAASAFALSEPWACGEDAYQEVQRQGLKAGGNLLIVAQAKGDRDAAHAFLQENAQSAERVRVVLAEGGCTCEGALSSLDEVPDNHFDDILYFGADADVVESLFAKGKKGALFILCQCGETFGKPVMTAVGGVHYRGFRIVGTTGGDPAEAVASIPERCEMRKGDSVNVIGAAGPMGVTHVIRDLCVGDGVTVYAADLSDERLEALAKIAEPTAAANGTKYVGYNPTKTQQDIKFDVQVVMAPVPQLVAAAVTSCAPKGIIDIFAGIPADKYGEIDLDYYCANQLYFIGTSGSTMEDIEIVLNHVAEGNIDTNVSVAAVSGLDDAVLGIRKVENQEVPGKIMVYPSCKGLELTLLPDLAEGLPEVADKLVDGVWTKEAEEALLAHYA